MDTAQLIQQPIQPGTRADRGQDERRLLNLQKRLARLKLLIIDELGFVPLSKTSAELLFEVFSQRYERGSVLVTTNLPFDEWTEVFGSERLTGALLDRLTHRVHILEMNGESYRLRQSRQVAALRSAADPPDAQPPRRSLPLRAPLNPSRVTAMIYPGHLGSGLTLRVTGLDAFKMICRPDLEVATRCRRLRRAVTL